MLLSRLCETNNAQTRRTCRETWSENIVLLKNPGIDWQALLITDWSGPAEVLLNISTIAGLAALMVTTPALTTGYVFAVISTGTGTGAQVVVYYNNAEEGEFIRLYPVKAAAAADAAGTSVNVQAIANFQGCLSEYDLTPQSETITITNTYGTLTDERISTYHYCLPD